MLFTLKQNVHLEGEGVSRASIIMISFRLENSSDGFDAVLVLNDQKSITYKVEKSNKRMYVIRVLFLVDLKKKK